MTAGNCTTGTAEATVYGLRKDEGTMPKKLKKFNVIFTATVEYSVEVEAASEKDVTRLVTWDAKYKVLEESMDNSTIDIVETIPMEDE